MKKIYQIKINGEVVDKYAVYYKSTATNVVIPNIKRAFELRHLNKPKIELIEV